MKRIGLFGLPVDNGNLGCVALTFSTLMILEKISAEIKEDFTYIIFDWSDDRSKANKMAELLNIDPKQIEYGSFYLPTDILRCIKHLRTLRNMDRDIKKCDFVIDLTEGDSFSDIYGAAQFKGRTRIKNRICDFGIPLMLGPQTYGPFFDKRNRKIAEQAIGKASAVLTRDNESLKLLNAVGRNDAVYTTDLAFFLPYHEIEKKECTKIRIGFNISNLLYGNGGEVKEKRFTLSTNYVECVNRVMNWLGSQDKYEIYLIPHVREDYETCKKVKKLFPFANLVEFFDNPIQAKDFIAGMDIFVGARMHATIAAFTTNVACIPMAYSRKFAGLFQSVGYDCLVDMQSLETGEAALKIIDYILDYQELVRLERNCVNCYTPYMNALYDTFKQWIISII